MDGLQCHAQQQNPEPTGKLSYLVDFYVEDEKPTEAYYHGIDLAMELTDRLSFLSYAPSDAHVLSVTVPSVKPNATFEIILPTTGYRRTRVQLCPQDIEAFDNRSNDAASIALRLFRTGISTDSPYRIFADLWTSVEAIGVKRATDAEQYVEEKCSTCGATKKLGPASHQAIRHIFCTSRPQEVTDKDAKANANAARRTRGKVVHGSRLHDATLRKEVEAQITRLQSASAVALVEELGVKPKSGRCQYLSLPYLHLKMACSGPPENKVCIIAPIFDGAAMLSFLPDQFCEPQTFTIEIGMFSPIAMDVRGLPTVEAS